MRRCKNIVQRLLTAASVVFLVACADQGPLAVQTSSVPAAPAEARGTRSFVCNLGAPDAHGRFQERSVSIRFSKAELDPSGRTRPYLYKGYGPHGAIALLGACEIPATDKAVARMDRFFRLRGRPKSANTITVQGCVTDGVCLLAPVTVTACQNGGTMPKCETTQPVDIDQYSCADLGTCPDYGSPGGGGPAPTPCWNCDDDADGIDYGEPEEDEGTHCPTYLIGKVVPALIDVAGRNHLFTFTGVMPRITGPRSPAKYEISKPTASEDNWWIARTGWFEVRCSGIYSPYVNGHRLWLGYPTFTGNSDLHMVMSASHPAF